MIVNLILRQRGVFYLRVVKQMLSVESKRLEREVVLITSVSVDFFVCGSCKLKEI